MKSVLVIDDEIEIINLYADYFSEAGFEVYKAENGVEALAACRKDGPFDLVITDSRMPKMSGSKFVATFLKEFGSENKPIIICVSAFQDIPLEQASEMGFDAVLPKPIDLEDLVAVSQHLLNLKEARKAA